MSRQTRFKPLSIYERFREEHGSWYDRVIKAEERTLGKGNVKAFSVRTATVDQREAIRTYMEQQDIEDFAGFSTWLKWNEMTYYDILKIVSP